MTVRDVTYDLLRAHGLTTVFGNPGSTEQRFLETFPPDFRYVLALEGASAIAMADEPVRAQDVPAAFMRAIATALQPPAGPVFLSLPLDDWDQPCAGPPVVGTVATRVAPDPERARAFADALRHASSPC